MDKSLPQTGLELSKLLKDLSENFHIKSSQYEILLYESAIIEAKSKHLLTGEKVIPNLQKTVLLNTWGKNYFKETEEIFIKVFNFHQSYDGKQKI